MEGVARRQKGNCLSCPGIHHQKLGPSDFDNMQTYTSTRFALQSPNNPTYQVMLCRIYTILWTFKTREILQRTPPRCKSGSFKSPGRGFHCCLFANTIGCDQESSGLILNVTWDYASQVELLKRADMWMRLLVAPECSCRLQIRAPSAPKRTLICWEPSNRISVANGYILACSSL